MAEARTFVQTQPTQNVDETGWREAHRRCWRWVSITAPVDPGHPQLHSRQAAPRRGLPGIVGSDRWSGYPWLSPERREVCWSHLKRDFQGLVDAGGAAGQVGQPAVALTRRLFAAWHQARDDPLAHQRLAETMRPLQDEFRALFEAGRSNPSAQAAGLCRALRKLWPALWTLVTVEGVEPTNNGAERALRRAVLWRRRSFGTQSEAGSRFVERILTAVTTLRQQQRDVLEYLTAACAAAIAGQPSPSLLPASAGAAP
ncbi:MAG: transposase [Chloroflexi bacterium]|nr:transposase [Chloroflexota bacterium]